MIQWPRVTAKLLAVLPTLDGWDAVEVIDGPPPGGGPASAIYATVGSVSDDNVGTFSTTQVNDGFQRGETGIVVSRLVCASGGNSLSPLRDRAFGLIDALDEWVRDNRTLGGVLSPEGTSDMTADVESIGNKNGIAVSLIFTLSYFTVT